MPRLIDIQDVVKTIADAIASVINMDIIICDNNLRKFGDTNVDWKAEYCYIEEYSIMTKVMNTGKTVVLKSKEEHDGCRICAEKSSCNLKALIATPIKYNNSILGCIGVLADNEDNKNSLLEKEKYIVDFVNRMADLIVSKLLEKESTDKLEIMKKQLSSIMNSMDDGIIALDENGYIIYANSHIKELMDVLLNEEKKKNIMDLIPKTYIKELVQDDIQFRNRELNIRINEKELQMIISGKTMKLEDRSIGAILTLKKMLDVYNVVNDVSLNNFNTSFDDMIGESFQMKQTKNKAKTVANSHSTILIQGESGTGKEILARAIHGYSDRKNKPFIGINCAAIPDALLESELFGYEEGAFTGAKRGGKLGKFQLAEGGTIFLDEIGEMPLHLQTKLLRVLQERKIEKVGGCKSIPINVRVTAATNKNLEEMVEHREFREDLFYRLNVIPIDIPPLRERKGDIKILLEYFLKVYNGKLSKNIQEFSTEVESILLNYNWKGNVRELENVVEYAVNMEKSEYIRMNSIPQKIKEIKNEICSHVNIVTIHDMEKKLIEDALKFYGSSVKEKKMVAQALGVGLATLYRKMKEYNIC
ncbi:sigma 54-interacting transcriptional regulator [Lutibacter sp. B2]|nr:sigma 54-interacting transcriptional regulator [Lutibacter sp. B2]